MTIRRFLESAGVAYEDIWPGDAVSELEELQHELIRKIQQRQAILVRIRRQMALICWRGERGYRNFSAIPNRVNSNDGRLAELEVQYRKHLRALSGTKRRLAVVRTELTAVRIVGNTF